MERPGGGRVGAEIGVDQSQTGSGGEQGFALPYPSARAQDGTGAGDVNACRSGAFVEVRLVRRGCRSDAGARSRGAGVRSSSSSKSARITWA